MLTKLLGTLWGIPVLLGLASLVGLISALVGDSAWDVLSWLLLGSLVAVVGYFWSKRNDGVV